MNNIFRLFCVILCTGLLGTNSGCSGKNYEFSTAPQRVGTPDAFNRPVIPPPLTRELVAIAGFENKSSFSGDKLWDTASQLLSTQLIQMGYFRVVEWEKMKQLFDWDMLASQSIIQSPEKRGEVQRILLCEYFISGAITSFDISQQSKISALSKEKIIDTSVRVDLLLQNATTGEYLSAATGEAVERQAIRGGVSGGQTGTWVSKAADLALAHAIEDALYKLTQRYHGISN